MLFSYNWLREFTDITLSPEELSKRLTMAGIEVEAVAKVGSSVIGVAAAEILSVGKHPNADKLSLCEVKTPDKKYSIVCGASNMKAGDRVALALAGAILPGGVEIASVKIRGVVSEGMMCSREELGLAKVESGIMILPGDTPLGKDINEVLGLEDFLLNAAITPNRPDCLSIMGLAREISAITGSGFREKKRDVSEGAGGIREKVSITVEDTSLCRRYTARVIEGVKVKESPPWLKDRLGLHGLRPVNNVVDAANYVMLEAGQPLHAFDLGGIRGNALIIRKAKAKEAITTIDGKTRELEQGMLVISDAAIPQAVAGIMGGKGSEVTEETTQILLESAWFSPPSVRRTSRALSLSSDSSYRFERGVDIEGAGRALDRAAMLVNELSGGVILSGMVDIYPEKYEPAAVGFRVKRAGEVLGMELFDAEVKKIFHGLNMKVKGARKKGCIAVEPPSYRVDIKTEEDLIEEVARLKGYDTVPLSMPVARVGAGDGPGKLFLLKKKTREILAGSGFLEVLNYSFVPAGSLAIAGGGKEGVIVLNPITEEQAVMRKSLLPSLIANLSFNLARKNTEVRIFECAPVFLPKPVTAPESNLPEERWKAALLMYGHRGGSALWNQPDVWLDFYDVKGMLENLVDGLGIEGNVTYGKNEDPFFHPGKGACAALDGKEFAIFGELHPGAQERFDFNKSVYLLEMDMEIIKEGFGGYRRYSGIARFPESSRDIAFIVDAGVPYGAMLGALKKVDVKLIENIEVFDVYSGGNIPEGKKSLALRITYRSSGKTLTYSEVEEVHSRVAKELVEKFNAALRI
ncbi:MAG: phenylalanine--tRNA ligase subunit beta [Deltaproteobacteria bacterium]|nr:phenylalanine--tRNA ligase subunit beta [Deltaproteobacteria bacterium]